MMTATRRNLTQLSSLWRLGLAGLVAATVALLVAPGQARAIAISSFSVTPTTTQAGAHPNFTTSIAFSGHGGGTSPTAGDDVKDLMTHLPPGLLANPEAVPRCSNATFVTPTPAWIADFLEQVASSCPPETIVGWGEFRVRAFPHVSPAANHVAYGNVYNLEPLGSEVLRLGTVPRQGDTGALGTTPAPPVIISASLRATDYGADALSLDAPTSAFPQASDSFPEFGLGAAIDLLQARVTLCGSAPVSPMPAVVDPFPPQCQEPAGITQRPSVTNPTSCVEGTSIQDMYTHAGPFPGGTPLSAQSSFTPTGCESVPFAPTVEFSPDTKQAGAPSGYKLKIKYPDFDENAAIYESHLKRVELALPEGVALNPGASADLEACTNEQFGFHPENYSPFDASSPAQFDSGFDAEVPACPEGSDIGDAKVETPLLDGNRSAPGRQPLTGDLYFAEPTAPGAPTEANPWQLFLEIEGGGVRIKLRGTTSLDQKTGQLKVVFDENPQAPFTGFEVSLRGGDRAILRNPTTCGSNETKAVLSPWSDVPNPTSGDVTATDSFTIDEGCLNPVPFDPSFAVSSDTTQAGANIKSTYTIARADGRQQLTGFNLALPAGLIGSLAHTQLCPAANARAGTCSQASKVGTLRASVGTGPALLTLPGKIYLAEPLAPGDAASISVVIPAKTGPLDLGQVVILNNIRLRPTDQGVEVVAPEIPTIFAGVPVAVRNIDIALERDNFLRNPTGCDERPYGITFTSDQGARAPVSVGFHATGCEALPFQPKLRMIAEAKGETARFAHPGLRVILTQTEGEANISGSRVVLPAVLRPDTVPLNAPGGLCQQAQFDAGACPGPSLIGHATVRTPLLPTPLSGPVYIIQRPGSFLPNLAIQLRGRVALNLFAQNTIEGVRTVNTFSGIPDVPVTSFELFIKGGDGGILKNFEDLCKTSDTADATFTAHSGKVSTSKPKLKVEGCTAPGIKILSRSVRSTKRGVAKVRLQCLAKERCTGRVTLKTKGKVRVAAARKARKRKLTLGRKSFKIAPGKKKTVKVKLRRSARRALRRASKRRLKARTIVGPRGAVTAFKTTRRNLTLKTPKRKRRR